MAAEAESGSGEEESTTMYRSFRYEVFGRVQGVFFRKYTQKEAIRLGIVGWVRNTPEGTVEGEAQGRVDQMKQFEKWLQTTGSPQSRIEKLEIKEDKTITQSELTFSSFDVNR
eukprot:TRINITY_DN11821_c0_g1_i2.p1 TRINITY_DN11821_c0_g1~~TRINITY_DN11821_c0_g1_i2.p1  ORF type:complete len:113 (-),score=34.11 TRINITY_DN11821_c0_g1_i2:199-537(-)